MRLTAQQPFHKRRCQVLHPLQRLDFLCCQEFPVQKYLQSCPFYLHIHFAACLFDCRVKSNSFSLYAAAINALKTGWGSNGLDLNSGWNWQPKNHGWFSISTVSTNFPSGLIPLIFNPFFIRISLKELLNSYLCLCLSDISLAP